VSEKLLYTVEAWQKRHSAMQRVASVICYHTALNNPCTSEMLKRAMEVHCPELTNNLKPSELKRISTLLFQATAPSEVSE
jgi:hypothetical protein